MLLDNGKVRCWGQGSGGRLGYGNLENIGDNELPSSAGDVDVGADVSQISAGGAHTCALQTDGDVRCWGLNFFGQLGYGHTIDIGDDEVPASVGPVNVGAPVTHLACGENHTCVVTDSANVRCWGGNFAGKLGYGHTMTIGDDELPATAGDVSLGGDAVASLAVGDVTCALHDDGGVRCWGANFNGELGQGNTTAIGDNELPDVIGPIDLGGQATSISTGGQHTCARLTDSTVRCWGSGGQGRLGHGNPDNIGDNELPASAGPVMFLP